jgi:hypothetical protein
MEDIYVILSYVCLMKVYARFYRRHLGSCIGFEIAVDTR